MLPRVQRILDTLDLLWACSNKRTYEYTDADVKAIFAAIREKLDKVEEAFRVADKPERKKFKLN